MAASVRSLNQEPLSREAEISFECAVKPALLSAGGLACLPPPDFLGFRV